MSVPGDTPGQAGNDGVVPTHRQPVGDDNGVEIEHVGDASDHAAGWPSDVSDQTAYCGVALS